jgi:hypothetical protein
VQSFVHRLRWLTSLVCFSLVLPLAGSAQTSAPAGAHATAANTTPAGQAPDDLLKKVSDLVQAGRYAQAQQSVTALLMLYPDDQRLIKAKALLDKSLASPKAADAAASSNPPTSNLAPVQARANANATQLTGMDKVDYNALLELVRQARQSTDLPQQTKLLQQFMDQSSLFLQKHPSEMLLWQLRAASAISLNDPMAGYEVGQKLLIMGAADSADSNLQQLLAQLRNKGWLDRQTAEKHAKYDWILGTWSVAWSVSWPNRWPWHNGPVVENRNAQNEEFFISGSAIEGYEIDADGVKSAESHIRGNILDSGEIRWEKYYSPAGGGSYIINYHAADWARFSKQAYSADTIFYPSGFVPVISFVAGKNKGTMTMVIPSQDASLKSKNPMNDTVTLTFTKTGSTQ